MCNKETLKKAISFKRALDIYPTIEACSNILCNLHINNIWLYFQLTVAFYVTIIFGYSIFYWYHDNKLKYFMAFFTNWVLIIQFIYFLLSSFITYKLYQEIQPKFKQSLSNRVRHTVSQQFDINIVLSNLSGNDNNAAAIDSHSSPRPQINNSPPNIETQGSYAIVGQPPDLNKLGYKNIFLFTKSLLELSLPYSFGITITYWFTLYSGHFKDIGQAIYYINAHGIIFVLQLFNCFGSTYQLRYLYGILWIFIFAFIGVIWMWLFEELKFVNPYTKTNQLYSIYDWHNNTVNTVINYSISVGMIILIYWFMVFIKNIILIHWKNSRQADSNKQLSADDRDYDSSDDVMP
eukprot:471789_1